MREIRSNKHQCLVLKAGWCRFISDLQYILPAALTALRQLFSAYIIDVYNRTALSPKGLWASTIPEVATGTAVHINLTDVTSLHWDPLSFHTVYFPLFSSLPILSVFRQYLWFLSSSTSAISPQQTWSGRQILFHWPSRSTNLYKKRIIHICIEYLSYKNH